MDAAFPIFASDVAHPTLPVNARNQLPHAPPLSSVATNSPLRLTPLPISPVTSVRVDRLDFLLHGYDHDSKRFLIDGFTFGFRLGFMGDERSLESSNLKSALSQPQVLSAKLIKNAPPAELLDRSLHLLFLTFVALPWALFPKRIPLNFV